MSLKSAARRGGILSVAAISALALASCSAGQITQTSTQVAAQDGRFVASKDRSLIINNLTVIVDEEGAAGLRLGIINQDPKQETHELLSATINGTPVEFEGETTIEPNCNLIVDIPQDLAEMPQADDSACITYLANTAVNPDLAIGGQADVTITFDNGEVTSQPTISAPQIVSGTSARIIDDPDSTGTSVH